MGVVILLKFRGFPFLVGRVNISKIMGLLV
jgi:hypothetical protein